MTTTTHSHPNFVYLALGTNLGDRLENLRTTLALLPPQVIVTATSRVYQTPPWGYLDQPDFLNMAVSAQTDLPPLDLLVYLKKLETRVGREVTFKNGPRLIDLDIIFYNNLILDTPTLRIPHPGVHTRDFVLLPLSDLNPDFQHPVLGHTVRAMLSQLDTAGITLFAEHL